MSQHEEDETMKAHPFVRGENHRSGARCAIGWQGLPENKGLAYDWSFFICRVADNLPPSRTKKTSTISYQDESTQTVKQHLNEGQAIDSIYLPKVCHGAILGVGSCGKSLLSALSRSDSVWQWEFDTVSHKLHSIGTFQVLVCDNCCSDDTNRARSCAVSAGHFVVQLAHSSSELDIPEFTVHIVGSRSRVVTQPNSVVLNG
mmetsp:Transcript_20580/g.56816  ORF Transcript_20580/g.56816 Transcript_20580/m.56816 type:complete len:202 (-) Transcript_20580:284-889(-)